MLYVRQRRALGPRLPEGAIAQFLYPTRRTRRTTPLLGKRQAPVEDPDTTDDDDLDGDWFQKHMSAGALLKSYRDFPIVVDLDSCAEVNLVDISFVREYKLQWSGAKSPAFRSLKTNIKTFGIFNVPISLTDHRNVLRKATLLCVAVDRDPADSLVLMGMPALS